MPDLEITCAECGNTFPFTENRTTTASVASAIRSVVNPAVMPAARTLAESDREGERNAKSLKLFAIRAASPTVCPSNQRRAAGAL